MSTLRHQWSRRMTSGTYNYPTPQTGAEQPFSIQLSAAPGLVDPETTLLRVGIQAEVAPAFDKRPANLVYLVDVSGSMQSAEKEA